jgi:hypothetical protein
LENCFLFELSMDCGSWIVDKSLVGSPIISYLFYRNSLTIGKYKKILNYRYMTHGPTP